jgi:L-asparaginase
MGTDAGINLVNAIRVAAAPESHGRGVLVMLNDEIHSAREVTKTSTMRLQTFRTADFGVLGHADADRVVYYRRPERRRMPDTEFDLAGLAALPRVDVILSYAGADRTPIDAFVAAGAKGLVSAGFAPGFCTPAEAEGLEAAIANGVAVVQSTRAGSGRVVEIGAYRPAGCILADNLIPQKARVLLMLALTRTSDPEAIQQMFLTY